MEEAAARRAAEALLREHKTGAPFKTFDASAGLTSMPDAYDIQDKYVALLRSEQGEPVGYKVGLTSKTMQTFCGIDHPIGGVVLAKRVLQSGATVRAAITGGSASNSRSRSASSRIFRRRRKRRRQSRRMSTASAPRSKSSTTVPPITASST